MIPTEAAAYFVQHFAASLLNIFKSGHFAVNPIRSNTPRNLFLLAFASLSFAGQANACSFDINHPSRYTNCVKDEAYNRIVDGAKRDAQKIVDDANNSANGIRSSATQVASMTLSAAYAAATKTKAVEPQLCE